MTSRSAFSRLVGETLKEPAPLAGAVVSLVAAAGGQLALTWVVKIWLERSRIPAHPVGPDLFLAAGLLTALLGAAVFMSRVCLADVNQRLLFRLREAASTRLLDVRIVSVRAFPSGDLLSRVLADTNAVSGFVETLLKRLMGDGLVAIGAIALMFTISPRLALIAAIVVPLAGALLSRIGKTIRRHGARAQAEAGKLSAVLEEQLRGVSTVKGYQTESFEKRRFLLQSRELRRRVMTTELWAGLLLAVMFTITGCALLLAIRWGQHAAEGGAWTPDKLVAFCLYAAQTVEPLRKLADVQGMLQRSLAAAERVFEIVDLPGIESGDGEDLQRPVLGAIQFRGVTFRHRTDTPLLDSVDLLIPPRQIVGFVAASGGGKSTIASLLVRHLYPSQGTILLDDRDLSRLKLRDVRRAICVVEQEPFLFSGSLAANLEYGSEGVGPGRVEEAIRLAGLVDLVAAHPDGVNRPIAEGGRDLSGGEKQRISLARAIVRDPAVVILDEATSALDSETEEKVFGALSEWLSRRTVLVAAHRFSTIRKIGRVVVIDRGRVVGDGPVPLLLSNCAAFSQLFGTQVNGVNV